MSNLDFYCCCFFSLDGSQKSDATGKCQRAGGLNVAISTTITMIKVGNVRFCNPSLRRNAILNAGVWRGNMFASSAQVKKILEIFKCLMFCIVCTWTKSKKKWSTPLLTQDNNSLICSTDRLWCEVLFRTFKLLYWQLGLIGVCVMRLVSDLNPLMMLTRSIADT